MTRSYRSTIAAIIAIVVMIFTVTFIAPANAAEKTVDANDQAVASNAYNGLIAHYEIDQLEYASQASANSKLSSDTTSTTTKPAVYQSDSNNVLLVRSGHSGGHTGGHSSGRSGTSHSGSSKSSASHSSKSSASHSSKSSASHSSKSSKSSSRTNQASRVSRSRANNMAKQGRLAHGGRPYNKASSKYFTDKEHQPLIASPIWHGVLGYFIISSLLNTDSANAAQKKDEPNAEQSKAYDQLSAADKVAYALAAYIKETDQAKLSQPTSIDVSWQKDGRAQFGQLVLSYSQNSQTIKMATIEQDGKSINGVQPYVLPTWKEALNQTKPTKTKPAKTKSSDPVIREIEKRGFTDAKKNDDGGYTAKFGKCRLYLVDTVENGNVYLRGDFGDYRNQGASLANWQLNTRYLNRWPSEHDAYSYYDVTGCTPEITY